MLLATDESANVMVKRDAAMQPRELYVNLISCAWIAACVALYFLVTAIFDHSSWWDFFGSVAISALLYRVSLYYQLEKEGA
jgi:fatty acid desaturase